VLLKDETPEERAVFYQAKAEAPAVQPGSNDVGIVLIRILSCPPSAGRRSPHLERAILLTFGMAIAAKKSHAARYKLLAGYARRPLSCSRVNGGWVRGSLPLRVASHREDETSSLDLAGRRVTTRLYSAQVRGAGNGS
jgi:hypothetical protein